MRDWNGKVVVITGAGSGIGRALALAWAERGSSLALADVDEVGLASTRASMLAGRATPAAVTTHVVDVADRARMALFAGEVHAAHGHVDVLVNNAGVMSMRRFEDSALEEIDRVLGIDLMGVVHGCHFFLDALLRRTESHIVNMASMVAFAGTPTQSAYCMAKSGVRALSESLRAELAWRGVGVTCVFPGAVRTLLLRDPEAHPFVRAVLAKLEKIGVEPATVAERVIRGVERNAPRVLVGPDAFIVDRIARLSLTALPAIAGAGMRLARRFLG